MGILLEFIFLWLFANRFPTAVHSASDGYIAPYFEFEDFEKCRQGSSEGVYCFAKVLIPIGKDPINSSQIVTQFRRNVLERGICMADCERKMADLSESERQRLYHPKFEVAYAYTMAGFWKSSDQLFIDRYENLSNICINQQLNRLHNTTGYVSIDHCSTNDQFENKSHDWYQITFLSVIVLLVMGISVAYVLDRTGGAYYRGINENLIVSGFSIRQNWARLTNDSKSDLRPDFAYIDGLRTIICIMVMYSHCQAVIAGAPTRDQDFLERAVLSPFFLSWYSMNPGLVKIFMVITALLQTVHFLEDLRKNPKARGFRYFWDKLVYRLIRLMPVYCFGILQTTIADWNPAFEVGLAGYRGMATERKICRNYWWINLLLVNNLPFVKVFCMVHMWYIAADVQLFVAGMVVLSIVQTRPWVVKPLLGSLVVLPLLLVAGLVYFAGVEPVFPPRLSESVLSYYFQRYTNEIYYPSYTNMTCYASGMVIAYVYHHTKYNGLQLQHSKLYKTIRLVTPPLVALGWLPMSIFLLFEIDYRSPWVAAYAMLYFYFPVLLICVIFVENFHKPPGPIRALLSSKPLVVLGKLSYSVFVTHLMAMRLMVPFFALFEKYTVAKFFGFVLAEIVLAFLVGLVVYLCVEQPLAFILRAWYDQQFKPKKVD